MTTHILGTSGWNRIELDSSVSTLLRMDIDVVWCGLKLLGSGNSTVPASQETGLQTGTANIASNFKFMNSF